MRAYIIDNYKCVSQFVVLQLEADEKLIKTVTPTVLKLFASPS